MRPGFNQIRAVIILSKYSLLATLRSPTSVVFALLFPIIFIGGFGSMIGDQAPVLKLAVGPGCDTANPVFKAIEAIPAITIQRGMTAKEQSDALQKGRLTAILQIAKDRGHYFVEVKAAGTAPGSLGLLRTFLQEAIRQTDERLFPGNPSIATLSVSRSPGRVYRSIDFILPGQLGFSLLMAGGFGSAFLLFSL